MMMILSFLNKKTNPQKMKAKTDFSVMIKTCKK